jgi:hypothetical protein
MMELLVLELSNCASPPAKPGLPKGKSVARRAHRTSPFVRILQTISIYPYMKDPPLQVGLKARRMELREKKLVPPHPNRAMVVPV